MQFPSISRNLAEPLPTPISIYDRRSSVPVMHMSLFKIMVEPQQKKHSVTFINKTCSQAPTRTRSDEGPIAAQDLRRTHRFRPASRAGGGGGAFPPRSKSCDLKQSHSPPFFPPFFGGSMQPETQPLEALDRQST